MSQALPTLELGLRRPLRLAIDALDQAHDEPHHQARTVISGQVTTAPKTHDGAVDASHAVRIVHRAAIKSRIQALHQLYALVETASEPIRTSLRGLQRRHLLATCQSYRPGTSDDLISVTTFALHQLGIRILEPPTPTRAGSPRLHLAWTASTPFVLAPDGLRALPGDSARDSTHPETGSTPGPKHGPLPLTD